MSARLKAKAALREAPRCAFAAALVALAAIAALVAFPPPAYALLFDGLVDNLNQWICDVLESIVNSILGSVWDTISSITELSILTAPFDSMLGSASGGGTTVASMADSVNDMLVKPIALSVLALAMLVQLIHVAGKADQDAAMPILRDLVMIALFYVCFRWLINNSADLCVAVYTDLNEITKGIANMPSISNQTITVTDITDIGQGVTLILCAIILYLVSLVAALITIVMAYMRAIQLYIFAAFAPIPLALLGFEQSRQYGIGFIKNFVALVLAGAVMVFILFCFPLLINAAVSTGWISGPWEGAWGVGPLMLLAMCVLLAFGMIKSGSIARSVLGE